MSKVITLSRTFPAWHPKKGQPTYFVEKVWQSLKDCYLDQLADLRISTLPFDPKHHTIRSGKRFKTSDKVSLRVWSGRPYHSKQIAIAPDVEVVVYDFEVTHEGFIVINDTAIFGEDFELLAANDGLSVDDLCNWIKHPEPFKGQLIVWNNSITY